MLRLLPISGNKGTDLMPAKTMEQNGMKNWYNATYTVMKISVFKVYLFDIIGGVCICPLEGFLESLSVYIHSPRTVQYKN